MADRRLAAELATPPAADGVVPISDHTTGRMCSRADWWDLRGNNFGTRAAQKITQVDVKLLFYVNFVEHPNSQTFM